MVGLFSFNKSYCDLWFNTLGDNPVLSHIDAITISLWTLCRKPEDSVVQLFHLDLLDIVMFFRNQLYGVCTR